MKNAIKKRDKNLPKVFVMLSGGVDSSVAALLLKKSGKYDIRGAHLICWRDNCNQYQREAVYAMLAAKKIGIPFYLFDLEKEYKEKVFNYMISGYANGKTPNPDVMCNREIKFGVFLEKALKLGTDYVATGHYVKKLKIKNQSTKQIVLCSAEPINMGSGQKSKIIYKLLKAKDASKDQSYFLWTLTQNHLKHSLFPIGDFTKEDVRKIAANHNLPAAEKKDSQGLCFVGKTDFQEFLEKYIKINPGKVLNEKMEKIGIHNGVQFYTIGQRHGFKIANNKPQYVAERNLETNTLVLAENRTNPLLYKNEIEVENINWISGNLPKLPLKCEARIRYRGELKSCVVGNIGDGISVKFDSPQWAVAEGQSIVFYKNGEMLGGGVIK